MEEAPPANQYAAGPPAGIVRGNLSREKRSLAAMIPGVIGGIFLVPGRCLSMVSGSMAPGIVAGVPGIVTLLRPIPRPGADRKKTGKSWFFTCTRQSAFFTIFLCTVCKFGSL